MKEIAKLSLTFCFIWFLANYFYNYGLLYATITSSVVLSNTSPVWVYLIAISCLVPGATREKFNCLKALAIVVSLAGFSIIALEDSKGDAGESEKPVLGDVLSLVGAVCYALYATFSERRCEGHGMPALDDAKVDCVGNCVTGTGYCVSSSDGQYCAQCNLWQWHAYAFVHCEPAGRGRRHSVYCRCWGNGNAGLRKWCCLRGLCRRLGRLG